MEQSLKNCSHCGQVISVTAKFCPNCGIKFLAPITNFMTKPPDKKSKLSAAQAKVLKRQIERFDVD